MISEEVIAALAVRHPMDGFNGVPGRWVFASEVQAATGSYSDVQRFDAIAIGLVPSTNYARVIYEVKVSRADWLKELKPLPDIRYHGANGREIRQSASQARRIKRLMDTGDNPWNYYVDHGTYRKHDQAIALSTEFWVAAPEGIVKREELPPEAGLVEIQHWGEGLRCKTVVKAPVRDTACPDQAFWASVLRRTARVR